MKKVILFVAFVLLALSNPQHLFSAPAQESSISVKAELNKAFITIGELVEYRVTIKHTQDIKILNTIPNPSKDVFKVKTSENFEDVDGSLIFTGKKFTLTAFKLGDYILPPIKIEYLEKGKEPSFIETEKIYLKVKSVAEGEEKEDIRGIKTVLLIPAQVLLWSIVAIVFILLVLSPFIYRIIKRTRKSLKLPMRRVTPKEKALKSLHDLFDSSLLKQGQIKDYYLKFSEILCVFATEVFEVPAMEATTYEIDDLLRKKDIASDKRLKFKELLEFSDLAKFAKFKPSDLEISGMNKEAEKFVESVPLKPDPEIVSEVNDGV